MAAPATQRIGLTLKQMQQQVSQNKYIIQQLQRDLATLRGLYAAAGDKNETKSASTSGANPEEQKKAENVRLQHRVNELLHDVMIAEMLSGERQILPPTFAGFTVDATSPEVPPTRKETPAAPPTTQTTAAAKVEAPQVVEKKKPQDKPQPSNATNKASNSATPSTGNEKPSSTASNKKAASNAAAAAPVAEAGGDVHVGRLDMRIGRILEVSKHPDADSLYVEKVDVGDAQPRTIVSGLVKHVPIDQMQQRLAVFLCNLKPAKMRNVMSEGMIMCASCSKTGTVQILEVPANCVPGDRIFVPGYEMTPDVQMNPKKKIFETVKPDLRVNLEGVACYKGVPWEVQDGKGRVKAPSVVDAAIQ